MDYIGSKAKLAKWIFDTIKKSIGHINGLTFLDACSGTGIVSRYAAEEGCRVIANDIMMFPMVIANGSIGLSDEQIELVQDGIERLNLLTGRTGYFYRHFCDESCPPRLYFTADNARLIDRARMEIGKFGDAKVRDCLLYCALEGISRVSNTTGVQAAYLKKYKARALDRFGLRMEPVVPGDVVTFGLDILSLLGSRNYRREHDEDVLYIDPPYNQRQYGPNYHLYETFVRDDNPVLSGKTGLRNWKSECDSEFCRRANCLQYLVDVVAATTARVVFVSYSSDGLMTTGDIASSFPSATLHQRPQRRYRSDTSLERRYSEKDLCEYLFEIRKK